MLKESQVMNCAISWRSKLQFPPFCDPTVNLLINKCKLHLQKALLISRGWGASHGFYVYPFVELKDSTWWGIFKKTRWWHILCCVNVMKIWFLQSPRAAQEYFSLPFMQLLSKYKLMLFNLIAKGLKFTIYLDLIYELTWRWKWSPVVSLQICLHVCS